MSINTSLHQLTEDEVMIRDSVREFAENEVRPLVVDMDEKSKMKHELIQGFFELGIMGIEVPEKYDGMGGTFFQSILVIEELAKVDPATAVVVDVQNTLVNNAFVRWGNDYIKQTYLPQLATEKVGAYALSEAGSGSDAFALSTKAEDCGDHWKLNGRKLWITNGDEAEIYIVLATTDKDLGYKGITAFVVERGFEGFSVGKKEDKLGIRASSTCELILDNCIVPKENILGDSGKGYKVAIETLNEGRIGIGAQMIGLAQGSLDYAIKYIQEREQFGKPLAANQAIQFDVAKMSIELEAARLMVYNAARLKSNGKPFVKEAAMAKYKSSMVAESISSLALELLGGNGFTKEYPMEKYFRDSKIGKIYEGTSNMQLQTIAKMVIK
jgi:alkylation response protein AidB-like acyl-CoA dehydrogenase